MFWLYYNYRYKVNILPAMVISMCGNKVVLQVDPLIQETEVEGMTAGVCTPLTHHINTSTTRMETL